MLKTQKSLLMIAVVRGGLDLAELDWPEAAGPGASTVFHRPTGGSFAIDDTVDLVATITPGREGPTETVAVEDWGAMASLISQWAARLRG